MPELQSSRAESHASFEASGGLSLEQAAHELIRVFTERRLMFTCAESCTGGLVMGALTDIAGASVVLWGGVIAYSNACKSRLLDVDPDIIAAHGAVSRETAHAMASGALAVSGADIAAAVTGIAGPSGGSLEKPVGTVWFAWRASDGTAFEDCVHFSGDRRAIRTAAAERVLRGAVELALRLKARPDFCSFSK